MNYKVTILCLAVLLAACFYVMDVSANKDHGGKGKGMKCLGEKLNLDDNTKAAWKECKENGKSKEDAEAGEESGEEKKKKHHNPCQIDCLYRKLNMIKDDGTLDESKIKEHIKKVFPEAAQQHMITDNKECMKEVTEKLTTDDECKTIQKYAKCYHTAHKKNCHKKE